MKKLAAFFVLCLLLSLFATSFALPPKQKLKAWKAKRTLDIGKEKLKSLATGELKRLRSLSKKEFEILKGIKVNALKKFAKVHPYKLRKIVRLLKRSGVKEKLQRFNAEMLEKIGEIKRDKMEKLIKAVKAEKLRHFNKYQLRRLAELKEDELKEKLDALDEPKLKKLAKLKPFILKKLLKFPKKHIDKLLEMPDEELEKLAEVPDPDITRISTDTPTAVAEHIKKLPKLRKARLRYLEAKEKYLLAKEKFLEAREFYLNAKRELLALRKEYLQNPTEEKAAELLQKAIDILQTKIDAMIVHLKGLQERNIAVEKVNELISKLESYRDELSSEEITKERIIEIAKDVDAMWHKARQRIKMKVGKKMNQMVKAFLDKTEKVYEKLLEKVDQLKAKGINTEKLEKALAKFRNEIDNAKQAYEKAKQKYKEAETAKDADAIIRAAHRYLVRAYIKLKRAYHYILHIFRVHKKIYQKLQQKVPITEINNTVATTEIPEPKISEEVTETENTMESSDTNAT